MVEQTISLNGISLKVHSLNTLVVGSGAAAFRAAEALFDLGQRDIAILTEGVCMGTSRNTGSDKQTYYKLTLAGDAPDSVEEMARTLFGGGAMQGDIALVQAALSARSFLHLAEIGVPFPQNRYGEYSGYRTDHDARLRATSAGPLTSRFMTEKLEEQVRQRGIHIFDQHLAIGILTAPSDENACSAAVRNPETGFVHPAAEDSNLVSPTEASTIGLAALDMAHLETASHGVTLFNCTNIIYATGGPAGMYRHSVYPESQTGATGIALEAGALAVNLTESQYGIASVKFRWNLSGTYQQVLPRYVSTDAEGGDAREFLMDWYKIPGAMLDAVFLKGYQWPFDPAKTGPGGSSVVDLLVGMEAAKGRRIYLDFMENPEAGQCGEGFDFSLLGEEAHAYLHRSGALFGRPIDRLRQMNEPAIALFRSHGIDLETEWLEISVCAQHNNGGLFGNSWWESNLRHFFPVGEVAGTFGIRRPGGSALNATQVGALRAAEYIAAKYGDPPMSNDAFIRLSSARVSGLLCLVESLLRGLDRCGGSEGAETGENRKSREDGEGKDHGGDDGVSAHPVSVETLRYRAGSRMSTVGAHLRPVAELDDAIAEAKSWILQFPANIRMDTLYGLPDALRLRDVLLTRYAYLSAIRAYAAAGGGSRGSSLLVEEGVDGMLPGNMKIRPDNPEFQHLIGELSLQTTFSASGRILEATCLSGWTNARPVPNRLDWFETVWRDYREGKQYDEER